MKINKILEIKKKLICQELGLDYSLIDGDVYHGNVDLSERYDENILKKFTQLKIREVTGWFNCNYNNLISLEGCPKKIGKYFFCSYNNLISLEGCPEIVNWGFYCSYNNLISLEGCPEIVNCDFYCYNNELKEKKLPDDVVVKGNVHYE